MAFASGVDHYTVRYDGMNGNWALIKDGASRAVRRAETKQQLLPQARQIAKNNKPSTLKIEGMSGGTDDMNHYGETASH